MSLNLALSGVPPLDSGHAGTTESVTSLPGMSHREACDANLSHYPDVRSDCLMKGPSLRLVRLYKGADFPFLTSKYLVIGSLEGMCVSHQVLPPRSILHTAANERVSVDD